MVTIPLPVTGIIGRETEILQARALLRRQDVRLLTLTGTGGSGKTRLAIEIARLILSQYQDGAIFVPLAGVSDPELVLPAVANELGLGTVATPAGLASELGDRDLLIVLDNFEQVASAAPEISALLSGAPGLQLVVTSRSLLRISGEHQLQVLPLAAPDLTLNPTLAELRKNAAVQLFVVRAAAATGDFTLTESNALPVAMACTRLDGLPLALELAAARLRHLPLTALVNRLDHRLDLLVDGPRDIHPRQRSLRDAIAWSYSLLSPVEQQLLRRLSVFVGSFSFEAVQEIANHDHLVGVDALDCLGALIDSSLVRHLDDNLDLPYFGLLESIREFAFEQLATSDETETLVDRHGAYFLQLAETADAALDTPERGKWVLRLRADQDNLRHAIQVSMRQGNRERALRLGKALWAYWSSHAYFAEGRRWLEQAIAMPGEASEHLRISAIHDLGNLALTLFDLDAADTHYREARDLWNALGTGDKVAVTELGLGAVTRYQGRYDESETYYLKVRAAWSATDDPSDMAIIEHGLGAMYADAGNVGPSRARHHEALRLRRQAGDPYGLAYTLVSAAVAERWAGDRATSAAYASEARLHFQDLEDPDAELLAILVLARLAADRNRDSEAMELLRETFSLLQSNPTAKATIESLETLSRLLMRNRASPPAAMLLAAASAHRTSRSLVVPTPERMVVSDLRAAIAEDLGVTTFSAAWSAGLRLSLEQAIDEALHVIANPQEPTTARTTYDLTRREVEVLTLLTEHLSDREIADHLFLSPRTIERHVSNILLKMEAPNRRLAAAQAVRERLVPTHS